MSNQTKLKTHPTNEHTCHQAIIMGRFLQEQGSGFRIGFTAFNRLNESKSVKYFQFSQLFEHFLYSNVYVGNVGHYVLHLSIFLLLGVKDEMQVVKYVKFDLQCCVVYFQTCSVLVCGGGVEALNIWQQNKRWSPIKIPIQGLEPWYPA